MQAQERKNLVSKLINLKATVDNKVEPKKYGHLNTGRVHNRNKEVQKINKENQYMLNKIMAIMKRKPKGNGLDGVLLRQNNSNADLEEVADFQDSFQGNADISLIQSNVENSQAQPSRFSFEISPHLAASHPNVRPFNDHRKSNHDTQTYNSTQKSVVESNGSSPDVVKKDQGDDLIAKEVNIDSTADYQEADTTAASKNPFSRPDQKQQIGPSQSADIYTKGIEASEIFDSAIPVQDSDQKIVTNLTPLSQPSVDMKGQQDIITNQRIDKVSQKRFYPGQVTLNHVVRKKEVQRINRENMIMLKALNNVKPSVQRTVDQRRLHMKQEEYKRNLSKHRNVGNSVPKPRLQRDLISRDNGFQMEGLPQIGGRVSSSINQTEMRSVLPDTSRESFLRKRRTSQGNRQNWMAQNLLQGPSSQRSNTRNQRVVYNSNQSTISELNPVVDAASTNEDYHNRAMSNPDNMTPLTNTSFLPGKPYVDQPTVTSLASSTVDGDTVMQRSKRPSYLENLKKSPLLSSMTRHQHFPKSIVNRVLSQREQAEKEAFKRYGVVMKPTMSVSIEKPNYTVMPSISHEMGRRAAVARSERPDNRNNKQNHSPEKQIDVVLSQDGSQQNKIFAFSSEFQHTQNVQETGQESASQEPDNATDSQPIAVFGRNQSFQAISEEQVSHAANANREKAVTTLDPKAVTIDNDDYSAFTPSASIQPSDQPQQDTSIKMFSSGAALAIQEQDTPQLPANQKFASFANLKASDKNFEQDKQPVSTTSLNQEEPKEDENRARMLARNGIQSRTKTESQFSLPPDGVSAGEVSREETYSIPQESFQASEDKVGAKGMKDPSAGGSGAYSIEDFEDSQGTPTLQPETKKSQPQNKKSDSIGEDISITDEFQSSKNQKTETQGRTVGQFSVPKISAKKGSQASSKTIKASKSQIEKAYGIVEKKRQVDSRGVNRGMTNYNVSQAARINAGSPSDQMVTQGTGFLTEKQSRTGTAGIIQSKENIILSELSSKNNNQRLE